MTYVRLDVSMDETLLMALLNREDHLEAQR